MDETFENTCEEAVEFYSQVGAPTHEELQLKDVQLFPNPGKGSVTISLQRPAEFLLTVQLINLYGQQVHQTLMPAGTRQQILDVSGLTAGVYWVSLRNDSSEIYGTKLVITD